MSNELVRVEDLQAEVAPVVAMAGKLVVATPAQYQEAAEFVKDIKSAQRQVETWFADPVSKAHAAWKSLTTRKAETLQPLVDAEKSIKGKMIKYDLEQEAIRRAAEAKLQAEADERARRERERAEREAAKLKTPELRQARMEQAAAIIAPVVTVAAVVPEVKGQSIRRTWKARVTDPRAAVAAIMAWPDWNAYVEINGGELNRFAARTKGAVTVPGVEWFEDATLASTGR